MSNFQPNPNFNNPNALPNQFGQPINQPFNQPQVQPNVQPFNQPQVQPNVQPFNQPQMQPNVQQNSANVTTFSPQEVQLLNMYFRLQWENNFGRIYASQNRILICEIKSSYVPFEEFQILINTCEQVIASIGGCVKFIFEKRALRSFHQPSMEWYYTVWKPKMYQQYGLGIHRKLFPQEKWFLKCIEAGRHEIRTKFPTSIANSLDVRVCMTLEEAMNT